MNTKLDALLTTASLSQAEALVGRTISLTDGSASGVVKAVHVYSDGTVAELENGDKIVVGPGVSVS
jgi:flagellar basal-body rod modification protein FlgD